MKLNACFNLLVFLLLSSRVLSRPLAITRNRDLSSRDTSSDYEVTTCPETDSDPPSDSEDPEAEKRSISEEESFAPLFERGKKKKKSKKDVNEGLPYRLFNGKKVYCDPRFIPQQPTPQFVQGSSQSGHYGANPLVFQGSYPIVNPPMAPQLPPMVPQYPHLAPQFRPSPPMAPQFHPGPHLFAPNPHPFAPGPAAPHAIAPQSHDAFRAPNIPHGVPYATSSTGATDGGSAIFAGSGGYQGSTTADDGSAFTRTRDSRRPYNNGDSQYHRVGSHPAEQSWRGIPGPPPVGRQDAWPTAPPPPGTRWVRLSPDGVWMLDYSRPG